jgi:hypothetical protein
VPITVKLNGLAEAKAAVIGVPDKIAKQSILQMSQIAYDTMQDGADAHTKTGALFQSVYNRPTSSGKGREVGHDPTNITVEWQGGTNRAMFILFGTRPHRIEPKTRKALRWVDASSGDYVFAKAVNHPGYAGDDYMTRAAKDALDKLRDIISDISVFE